MVVVGRWVDWEWGSRVVVSVLRATAKVFESAADSLEGRKTGAKLSVTDDEPLSLTGTRARIRATLDRARDRYQQVTPLEAVPKPRMRPTRKSSKGKR